MEMNGINAGTTAGGQNSNPKLKIPISGPDAIANGVWYRVAMTYTGTAPTNGDPTGILTMSWTISGSLPHQCRCHRHMDEP